MPTTHCKNCKFAIKDNDEQTGCFFNVEKSLVYNYPEIYSDENFGIKDNYWTINDYICMYRKPLDYMQDDPVSELPEYRNIGLLLVYFLDDNIDDFTNNMQRLANSNISPEFISIIGQYGISNHTVSDAIHFMNQYSFCKWKFHRLLRNLDAFESVDLALTNTARKNKTQFYSVWSNSLPIPDQYYTMANSAIFDLLTKRPVVSPFCKDRNNVDIGQVIPFFIYGNEKNVNSHALTMHNLFTDNIFPEYYQIQIQTDDKN